MADRCRPDDDTNPGLALGVAMGALARRRPRQADARPGAGARAFGAWAGAAHRREHRQARHRHRAGGRRAARARRRSTARTASSSASAATPATDWRAETDAALDALAAAGHPVIDLPLDDRRVARRRVLPLGVRDGRGRHRARRQPVRRAERDRVEGEHQGGPGALPRGGRAARGAVRWPARGA